MRLWPPWTLKVRNVPRTAYAYVVLGALALPAYAFASSVSIWAGAVVLVVFLGVAFLVRAHERARQAPRASEHGVRGLSTDRAPTADALGAAETKYRTLVEQLPLVTYINDGTVDRAPLYVSPQIEGLLGYPASQWLADSAFYKQVLHPDDLERLAAEIERFEREGGRFECEYRMIAADGRIVWVLDQMALVRDEAGLPICFQGYCIDITARKEAEARYRTLVEHLPLVTYSSSLHEGARLSYVSPQIENLLGYTAEEFLADPELVERNLHPDDAVRVWEASERVRRDLDRFQCEYRLFGRDGEPVWLLDDMAVMRDEEGEPLFFQGFLLDITPRKKLEEQLQKSQRLEVVGRLAGGIAHDFNNILTAITGYNSFALEHVGESDATLRGNLVEVQRAAERAAALTQQLLAFSRRQVLQPRPVELVEIVGETRDLLARLLGEHIELVTRAAPEPAVVLADPGRLEQVLVILAVNARDAMPDGGTLTIETGIADVPEDSEVARYGARPGSYGVLTVRDTGYGMDLETLARVFEPFFTTKQVGDGTGLGLSTVYGIVKQSGGWITIDSEPAAGTTVTIYLEPTGEAPVEVGEPSGELSSGSETILLVEDEPVVLALVAEMLRRQGYQIIEAASPTEALALGDEPGFDLLVTDVVMPKMNGRELARRLRERLPDLQVVFTSGYTPEAVLGDGLETGESFLQKPFSGDELGIKVREALDALATPLV